jgi:hypothetical protein
MIQGVSGHRESGLKQNGDIAGSANTGTAVHSGEGAHALLTSKAASPGGVHGSMQ